ncbi:MAG: cell division protein FtsZ [Bacillota bacterium]|nr:cell division protein FtsZ [Bacillota bacterium]
MRRRRKDKNQLEFVLDGLIHREKTGESSGKKKKKTGNHPQPPKRNLKQAVAEVVDVVEEIKSSLDGGFMNYQEEDIVKILVVGVGGAGNNVVNRIVRESASDRLHSYSSIKFVIVNTDKQALLHSNLENKILIGESTKGQGAGSDPEKGRKAAEESEAALAECVAGMDLVFVTAGMGGGTGTGASPVIARLAKEAGALVVAVVSTPFRHEGSLKLQKATDGIEKLKEFADALIIIDNNKLVGLSNKKLSFADVFALADEPLKDAILGIAGTVLEYGNEMNTDFSDIRAIMENKGLAHMAVGSSSADEGAGLEATRQALESTLTNTSIRGATGVVFKIQSSDNLGFDEFNEMIELVSSQCDTAVLMKHGKHSDPSLGNEVRVTIIATGVRQNNQPDAPRMSGPSLTFGKTPTLVSEEPKKTGLNIPKGFR